MLSWFCTKENCIIGWILLNNFSVTCNSVLFVFFFFEQSFVLCIHNNVSVNNKSVRICRVLRASLTVWKFLHYSGNFQKRTTGYHIFPFTGVVNMFSACFVKKEFCIPVSWVWCLGNNLCEKYAFTFIQHSRSTLWLISTEAYNYPEASKFRLFV